MKEEQLKKRIMEKASKTHKQRVEEFNRHLDSLTEHFDIPKVSWTKWYVNTSHFFQFLIHIVLAKLCHILIALKYMKDYSFNQSQRVSLQVFRFQIYQEDKIFHGFGIHIMAVSAMPMLLRITILVLDSIASDSN